MTESDARPNYVKGIRNDILISCQQSWTNFYHRRRRDFYGHITGSAEDYLDHYGRYGFAVRNMEQKWILEFCATMKITVANIPFKTRKNHLVTYESDPSRAWVYMKR